jgi:hypothetical protein
MLVSAFARSQMVYGHFSVCHKGRIVAMKLVFGRKRLVVAAMLLLAIAFNTAVALAEAVKDPNQRTTSAILPAYYLHK